MQILLEWLHVFLHMTNYIPMWVGTYGAWVYAILFIVILSETGLVIAPFLPGDSLLFAVGSVCSLGHLNIWLMSGLLMTAAILGNLLNYGVGHGTGQWLTKRAWVKPSYLEHTRLFYQQYGAWAVILARFLPVLRTGVPFVAGLGAMSWGRFVRLSIVGSVLWVGALLGLGFAFGQISSVQNHFSWVILGIATLSAVPFIIGYIRRRIRHRPQKI